MAGPCLPLLVHAGIEGAPISRALVETGLFVIRGAPCAAAGPIAVLLVAATVPPTMRLICTIARSRRRCAAARSIPAGTYILPTAATLLLPLDDAAGEAEHDTAARVARCDRPGRWRQPPAQSADLHSPSMPPCGGEMGTHPPSQNPRGRRQVPHGLRAGARALGRQCDGPGTAGRSAGRVRAHRSAPIWRRSRWSGGHWRRVGAPTAAACARRPRRLVPITNVHVLPVASPQQAAQAVSVIARVTQKPAADLIRARFQGTRSTHRCTMARPSRHLTTGRRVCGEHRIARYRAARAGQHRHRAARELCHAARPRIPCSHSPCRSARAGGLRTRCGHGSAHPSAVPARRLHERVAWRGDAPRARCTDSLRDRSRALCTAATAAVRGGRDAAAATDATTRAGRLVGSATCETRQTSSAARDP